MATCIFEKECHVATYESIKVMAYLDPYLCSIILVPGFHHTILTDDRYMLKNVNFYLCIEKFFGTKFQHLICRSNKLLKLPPSN